MATGNSVSFYFNLGQRFSDIPLVCLTRRAVDMKEVQDFKMEMKGRPE